MGSTPVLFTTLAPIERPTEAFLISAVAGSLQAMMGTTAATGGLGCFFAVGASATACLLPAAAGLGALLVALLLIPLAIFLYARPVFHRPCGAAIIGVSFLGGMLGLPWLFALTGTVGGLLAYLWRRPPTIWAFPSS
jgi:hypothetical protein